MATSSSAASLTASVSSLRSSLSLLDSSIAILDTGISDFPRLSTVLTTTRHFELTPSSNLDVARASLASELAPAITTLLNRAESYCAKLERREQALVAKSELQEGRLGQGSGPGRRGKFGAKAAKSPGLARGGGELGLKNDCYDAELTEIRLKALRQKKERLAYAVERLTLQSQQRQRQLRMSVNVSAS